MEFEWDERKASHNLRTHGIAFHEAASVFGDSLAVTFNDPDHSVGEARLLTFGESMRGRLLAVIHTAKGDTIRIISARRATRKERVIYEDG
jgi:hypothetical protein